MSRTNEASNASFRGMSKSYPLYQKITNVFRSARIDNSLSVRRTLVVGGEVEKDMYNDSYTSEFDPFEFQSSLFPGMADFIEDNILQGDKVEDDRFVASAWDDLGDDIFDDWGYFFLYDVSNGKYYFPILSPQNQIDGFVTTQTFSVFEVTFTITHGWREKGIFMMDISCSDTNFRFRFGTYGNLGSDGDENDYDMTATYDTSNTLFYHHHSERDNELEILYTYVIPYLDQYKSSRAYNSLYISEDVGEGEGSDTNHSLITTTLRSGVKVFFAKKNDVKDWVITDITTGDFSSSGTGDLKTDGHVISEGNIFSKRTILASGSNLGQRTVQNLRGDYDYFQKYLVDTYFICDVATDNRTFYIPSCEYLFNSIANCQSGTSFRFTINNYANTESGYEWNLSTEGTGNMRTDSVKNMTVPAGCIITYMVILYRTMGEGYDYSADLLQESEPYQIIL